MTTTRKPRGSRAKPAPAPGPLDPPTDAAAPLDPALAAAVVEPAADAPAPDVAPLEPPTAEPAPAPADAEPGGDAAPLEPPPAEPPAAPEPEKPKLERMSPTDAGVQLAAAVPNALLIDAYTGLPPVVDGLFMKTTPYGSEYRCTTRILQKTRDPQFGRYSAQLVMPAHGIAEESRAEQLIAVIREQAAWADEFLAREAAEVGQR